MDAGELESSVCVLKKDGGLRPARLGGEDGGERGI
jgi:hypothetical protein